MVQGDVVRQRSRPDGTGTPGAMVLENGFSCDTLELNWHNNERGRSCTKADTYTGKVWWSPTLKRFVIRYEDKNERKDCLVHNGNFAGDEQLHEKTNVHGCTEVGKGYGELAVGSGKQWGILHSGDTLAELIESLRCEPAEADTAIERDGVTHYFHDVEIRYLWADGAAPEAA